MVPEHQDEGGQIVLTYDSSQRVTGIVNSGVLNFSPQDTTAQYLQPSFPVGYTSNTSFTLNYINPASSTQPGVTQYRDSNRHQMQYAFDTFGRISSEDVLLNGNTYYPDGSLQSAIPQGWTQTRNYSYDADGNLIDVKDSATGYELKHWYDAYGRLVETQQPATPFTGFSFLSGGTATLSLLERYIYDDSNGKGNPVPYGPTPALQYGGLYAVQRYTGALDGNSWQTEEEMSYDELGRLAAHVSRGSCGSVTYIAGPLFCGSLNSFQVNLYDPVTGRLSCAALPPGIVVGFAYVALRQLHTTLMVASPPALRRPSQVLRPIAMMLMVI